MKKLLSFKSALLLTVLTVLTVLVVVGFARAVPVEPFSGLKNKTGWIILGIIRVPDRQWFGEPTFESINGQDHSAIKWAVLPLPQERIRLKNDQMLHIVGFAPERRRDETGIWKVPASVDGSVNDEDRTGILLPAGTTVKVDLIAVGNSIQDDKRVAWAKVSPN